MLEAAGILTHRSDRLDQPGGYGEASRRLEPRCYSASITGGLPDPNQFSDSAACSAAGFECEEVGCQGRGEFAELRIGEGERLAEGAVKEAILSNALRQPERLHLLEHYDVVGISDDELKCASEGEQRTALVERNGAASSATAVPELHRNHHPVAVDREGVRPRGVAPPRLELP